VDDTTAPSLTSRQRKHLRGLAHSLEPLVSVGAAGLSPGVLGQIDAALTAHELIKVRLRDPEDKKALADEIASRSGAALCGLVGHVVILYRANPEDPRISPD
jgi:RNA-binding protein